MNGFSDAREAQRLAELERLNILDTATDENIDLVGQAAAAILDVPIALVSLVARSRQWFKTAHGLAIRETPLDVSFCRHAIERPGEVMVVNDALKDKRFAHSALVTGSPNIRFYAGAPLVTSHGFALGTVCAIDRRPRTVTPSQLAALTELANVTARLIELSGSSATVQDLRRLIPR